MFRCFSLLEKKVVFPPTGKAVMAKARKPHAAGTFTVSDGEAIFSGDELLQDEAYESFPRSQTESQPPQQEEEAPVEREEQRSPVETPDSPTEAYRFLLNHIDAEIAALQRRQKEVVERRQKVEQKQSTRIKEIFEYIEQPWLFLETPVPPPLPATGVDVYIKEMTMNKKKDNSSDDKMFVLACHKNYRSLDWSDKRPYEQAAEHNNRLREELKRKITAGCSRFEAFCGQIRECTAEMIRRGEVRAPPPMQYQPRPWSKRYQEPKSKVVAEEVEAEPEEKETPRRKASRKTKKATTRKPSTPKVKRAKRAIKKEAKSKATTTRAKRTKQVAKKKRTKVTRSPSSAVKSIPLPAIDMEAIKRKKQNPRKSASATRGRSNTKSNSAKRAKGKSVTPKRKKGTKKR